VTERIKERKREREKKKVFSFYITFFFFFVICRAEIYAEKKVFVNVSLGRNDPEHAQNEKGKKN
jgi:hypothetical protein